MYVCMLYVSVDAYTLAVHFKRMCSLEAEGVSIRQRPVVIVFITVHCSFIGLPVDPTFYQQDDL